MFRLLRRSLALGEAGRLEPFFPGAAADRVAR
jgi:hypothetical protein